MPRFAKKNSITTRILSCFLQLQSAWCLKTRALTEQVYVDEVDVDEQGIAEMLMDDNAVAQLPSLLLYVFVEVAVL